MSEVFGFDAFSPGEIAERFDKIGVSGVLLYHVIYRRGATGQ